MKLDDSHGFDPRNKVVSFRLSDGEYDLAQEFCKASGYRGMSMLARSAFLAYMPHKAENGVEDDPALLQTELKSLHMELAKLIASLSKFVSTWLRKVMRPKLRRKARSTWRLPVPASLEPIS